MFDLLTWMELRSRLTYNHDVKSASTTVPTRVPVEIVFCSVLEFGPVPTPPTPLFQGAPNCIYCIAILVYVPRHARCTAAGPGWSPHSLPHILTSSSATSPPVTAQPVPLPDTFAVSQLRVLLSRVVRFPLEAPCDGLSRCWFGVWPHARRVWASRRYREASPFNPFDRCPPRHRRALTHRQFRRLCSLEAA